MFNNATKLANILKSGTKTLFFAYLYVFPNGVSWKKGLLR